ncbi:unnamed protein product, partial [marine sediment metagenome]
MKVLNFFRNFLTGDGTVWATFTLTADRTKYINGMDCYETWRKGRALGEFIRRGRKAGLFTGRWFAYLEWQGGVWPHFHLCAQLTADFAARLARAYRSKRGRGIIEINNDVVGPLWRNGFTSTTLNADPAHA